MTINTTLVNISTKNKKIGEKEFKSLDIIIEEGN